MSEKVVEPALANLKQGDILEQPSTAGFNCSIPDGDIAVVSQTCDVRNKNREFVSVAPVIEIGKGDQSNIKKGRKPLFVPVGPSPNRAANLEEVHSVPRDVLVGCPIVGETVDYASGKEASVLSSRIGRAYSRAALPDEVNLVMQKFSTKLRDRYFKSSHIAEALDYLADIRIGCQEWNQPGRELTLYYLLPAELLSSEDFIEVEWTWSTGKIHGLDPKRTQCQDLSFEKTAELICSNIGSDVSLGTKYALWEHYADHVYDQYLQSELNTEVASIHSEVVSALDFNYDQFIHTESLEFSALSYSSPRGE